MSLHFSPQISWKCLREILSLVRKGSLTPAERTIVTDHGLWFAGGVNAWLAGELEAVPEDEQARGLLASLRKIFSVRFGDIEDPSEADILSMSTEALCDEIEVCLPDHCPDESGEDEYGAFPWVQILTVVIPILIELLRRNSDSE